MQVKDVMVHDVSTVRPEDTLRTAAEKIKSLGLDPLPVWDGCKLIGMLTRTKIQEQAVKSGLAAGTVPVREAMIPGIVFCYDDEDVREAARRCADPSATGLPGLLVLDRSRQLVGVVSASDLSSGTPPERPPVMSAEAGAQPKADFDRDPVELQSEESYPASDPPAPPSTLSPGEPQT
jgi:CBS domain-containing protein